MSMTVFYYPKQLLSENCAAILAQRRAELVALLPDSNTLATNPVFAENFSLDEDLITRRKATQALLAQAGPRRAVGELKPENQLRHRFRLVGERTAAEVSLP